MFPSETQWDPPTAEESSTKQIETPASPTNNVPKKAAKKKKDYIPEQAYQSPKKVQKVPRIEFNVHKVHFIFCLDFCHLCELLFMKTCQKIFAMRT